LKKIINSAKYLFVAAVAGLAMISLITSSLPVALIPVSKTAGSKVFIAWLFAIILLTACISIIINKMTTTAAYIIAAVFFFILVAIHLPLLIPDVHNANEWVAFLEILSISCGGFLLAAIVNTDIENTRRNIFILKSATIAKFVFALAIVIFGVQHIMYEQFIITLIPAWLPFKQFWAYMVEAAFILTPISILLNIKTRLATFLLGLMFITWVLILHAPRVFNAPKIKAEWTSMFIALAMGGISLMIASIQKKTIK
jgi:uncharacterized membrane protein YphA (DoxX/SURF4 family)